MRLDKTTNIYSQSCFIILVYMCLLILSGIRCGVNKDHTRPLNSTVTVAHPGFNGRGMSPAVEENEKFLVFLPLWTINKHGERKGCLTQSWEYSSDYHEITYHLRKDIRWHDGVPVTAHDIKFSMELSMHPDVLWEGPGYFGTITVLDDYTLRIRDGVVGVDNVYWPKHLLEGLDPKEFYDWEFWKHPVGNGPYRFVRYVPQTMMEFEANTDYFLGKPQIEHVILKFSGKAGLTDLLSGNVDAVLKANPLEMLKLKDDPRYRLYYLYEGWWLHLVIYWQQKHLLFRDSRVRRALTLAIDRRELRRLLHMPDDIPIVDGPPSFRQLSRGQFPEPLPYDPDEAQTLLDAAGWFDRDGDGIRENEEKPASFTLIVGNLHPYYEKIAVYIQDKLNKIGVRMNIKVMDSSVVLKRIADGDCEAGLSSFFFGGLISRLLSLGYQNPKLSGLLNRMDFNDSETEEFIFLQIMEIMQQDLPITFLLPRMQAIIAHRRIQGLSTPWWGDPLFCMEHLWIEEEK